MESSPGCTCWTEVAPENWSFYLSPMQYEQRWYEAQRKKAA